MMVTGWQRASAVPLKGHVARSLIGTVALSLVLAGPARGDEGFPSVPIFQLDASDAVAPSAPAAKADQSAIGEPEQFTRQRGCEPELRNAHMVARCDHGDRERSLRRARAGLAAQDGVRPRPDARSTYYRRIEERRRLLRRRTRRCEVRSVDLNGDPALSSGARRRVWRVGCG